MSALRDAMGFFRNHIMTIMMTIVLAWFFEMPMFVGIFLAVGAIAFFMEGMEAALHQVFSMGLGVFFIFATTSGMQSMAEVNPFLGDFVFVLMNSLLVYSLFGWVSDKFPAKAS